MDGLSRSVSLGVIGGELLLLLDESDGSLQVTLRVMPTADSRMEALARA